ncbi:MAG: M3 family metallopeptidase, partial [Myxococcota bacterium]
SLDLSAFQQKMMMAYSPYPHPKDTHGYASFGHLSGYSSAYYTYQWSLVLAKDIFTRFDREGLLSPSTAADYRRTVLMPGGSKDAAELVRDFLGRDSRLDAYKAWLER